MANDKLNDTIGAPFNVVAEPSKTAVDYALQGFLKTGDDAILRKLVEAGGLTGAGAAANSKTPMDYALRNYLTSNDATIIRMLVAAAQESPLKLASDSSRDGQTVERLLAAGADVNVKDTAGKPSSIKPPGQKI